MTGSTTAGIDEFITLPEIAKDANVTINTVHNWLRYHRYMNFTQMLGRPVVHRADYEAFKQEHPELLRPRKATAA